MVQMDGLRRDKYYSGKGVQTGFIFQDSEILTRFESGIISEDFGLPKGRPAEKSGLENRDVAEFETLAHHMKGSFVQLQNLGGVGIYLLFGKERDFLP